MHVGRVRHSYSPFFPLGLEVLVDGFVSLPPLEEEVDEFEASEEAAFVSEVLFSLPLLSDEALVVDLLSADADFLYDSLR
jgi:hypothetical protein